VLLFSGTLLVQTRDVRPADAIVALGSHEWERFPAVARLARRDRQARVLLTEPVKPTVFNCHLCAERAPWLVALGVERTRIVFLPRRVKNTYDEALAAREYCRQHSIRTLLVVTSPYHTRRALATFASVFQGTGTTVGVYAATAESPARPQWWWLTAYDRWYVSYEWAALAWYAVRHQINPAV
jgi:uncharacterized SAM-binding protein YcdF (DUF218 family)